MKTAVIILGHGSRSSVDRTLESIALEARNRGRYPIVEYAYLQHALPDAEEALMRCTRQGAEKIILVPFFLLPGSHVTKDIPALVDRAKKQYPGLEITVSDFVGTHRLMTDIVLDLAETRE